MESASYIAYLMSEPRKVSCVKASEVLEVSHDEINRFLLSNQFSGKDLLAPVKQGLVSREAYCRWMTPCWINSLLILVRRSW